MFHLIVSILLLLSTGTLSTTPDGVIDTTQNLLKAWRSACESNSGGTIVVAPGTFILNKVTFQGPCKGLIKFNINGILKAPYNPLKGEQCWVLFTNVYGLKIYGPGTFDGQGAIAWKYNTCDKGNCENAPLPTSVCFNDVKDAIIHGITSLNSKFFHFHIGRSSNIDINKIRIIAPGSTNINISSVICGPGHGISIGSLGRFQGELPVKGIIVSNSSFIGTQNGARIKTFGSSFSSSVSNVIFQDLKINNVENPIIIDQNYCPHNSCKQKGNSNVRITNVKFINIRGTSASSVSLQLHCSGKVPRQEIELQDLNLTYKDNHVHTKATCSNFKGIFNGNNQDPPNCINVA